MTKEQELELEFRRGYYLATANIMRTHDADVIAADVLHSYGKPDLKGIDPLEIKILKPIIAELRRHGRL